MVISVYTQDVVVPVLVTLITESYCAPSPSVTRFKETSKKLEAFVAYLDECERILCNCRIHIFNCEPPGKTLESTPAPRYQAYSQATYASELDFERSVIAREDVSSLKGFVYLSQDPLRE